MKKICTLLLILISTVITAQVGIGTNTPNTDAALEVNSTNKGVLITKVNLMSSVLATPLSNHVKGMIVYNMNINGSGNTAVSDGFYYNNGAKWMKLEPIPLKIGDLKQSIATNDHLGWYKLDGRTIASLPILSQNNATSLGFTVVIPDATDKILKAKSSFETLGQTGGDNKVIISQNNLPNVNFLGTSSIDGLHDHSHNDRHNSNVKTINLVYGLLGILSGIGLTILNNNVGNKTPATTISTSSNAGNHSHTATVSSGGTNTPIDNVKHLITNTFIYLGE